LKGTVRRLEDPRTGGHWREREKDRNRGQGTVRKESLRKIHRERGVNRSVAQKPLDRKNLHR